ncbi:oxidoreductase [Streptomyces sp. LRE541]|uniref:oxidoreductase n=1 Tax=Streptomyces sp. LRE541 TaxID=2931983 RepID=UPI00200EE3FA|nr:oxidoreductase [Streptomyces sp. LRE541]UPZ31088.1 oxidoreductase [Streptomyces sp. LRE541]
MLQYDDLTPPERAVWDAFPEGRVVDLSSGVPEEDDAVGGPPWGLERTVRAEVLAALLLGANSARPGAVAALNLTGARIVGHLDLAGGDIAHTVHLASCRLEETVNLRGSATRTIRMTYCRVRDVNAQMARIEGRFDLRGTTLRGGRLALTNAHVSGELSLNGATLEADGKWALFAGGLVAEGAVFCRTGFTTKGGLRLLGAQLSGGLFLDGARLENPDGEVLIADSATITTLELTDGFSATGAVRLRGAHITNRLSLRGATLAEPGAALDLARLQVAELELTPAVAPPGGIDLRSARVEVLRDNETGRTARLRLEGLAYTSLHADDAPPAGLGERVGAARRVAWIRRSPGYSPQPYEQLAGWYRLIGHDDDARLVLLEKQRHRRGTLHPVARIWGRVFDATVGYGYRPWRAGGWLILLSLIGTLVFRTHTPTANKQGEGPPFSALAYTLDLLIPIGGFGQRGAWHWKDPGAMGLSYALIAAGWLLTTAVVAGITRSLNKN